MEERAAKILQATIYAAIATSSVASTPWNTPVYVVFDEDLHFYWASGRASQHSRNIRENPKVFLGIYNSSVPWGAGEGVFIQATAVEVDDPAEITKACRLRVTRASDAKQPPADFMGDRPRRIYRATPEKIWTNQDGQVDGHFVDQRVEINLDELRKALRA